MVETVANTWIAVPIIEGMGYYAVNPETGRAVRGHPRPARTRRRVRAHAATRRAAVEEVTRAEGFREADSDSAASSPRRRPAVTAARIVGMPGRAAVMKRYIVYRLLQGVVLLCLVATIVFFLGRLTGNPVDLMLPEDATAADRAAMIKALGLDGPLWQQFLIFHQERAARRSRHVDPHAPAGGRGVSRPAAEHARRSFRGPCCWRCASASRSASSRRSTAAT